jgi:methylated-DNA-[protein]-cysteine S-methyltransferase
MALFTTIIETPVGEMIAAANDQGICLLDYRYRKMLPAVQKRISDELNDHFEEGKQPLLDQLRIQLIEYFAGIRQTFSLPLQPAGSVFQQKVWFELMKIPYGKTYSYLQLARACGDEQAVRAVASANGQNGLALLIPCHRVIGNNGSLTGYAGGLPAKRWLLDHERKHSGEALQGALF